MCGNMFPYFLITLETVITLKTENIQNLISYILAIAGLKMKTLLQAS